MADPVEKLGFIGYEEIGHTMSTQNTIEPGKWYCIVCGESGNPFPPNGKCDPKKGSKGFASPDFKMVLLDRS